MLELRMRHDVLHRVHDLRHAGLVIGPEEGRAVGGDERLSHEMKQFRELGRLQGQAGNPLQGNLPAVVLLNDLRLYIRPGSVRSRVHMGDEADGRHFLVHIGRDASHHVPELVQRGLHAHRVQFRAQHPQQVPLLLRRRLALRLLIGLRVHRDVP